MFRKKLSPLFGIASAPVATGALAAVNRMPRRRMILGLLTCTGLWLALAPAAWAQDTVQASATTAGSRVAVQVSGWADACSYCTSEAIQVDVDPTSGGSSVPCWPTNPQATYPVSNSGGSFSFSPQLAVDSGQQYEVCGFIVQSYYGLQPFPSAESQPVLVSLAPAACPPGTEHALRISAPRSVPLNLRGVVDVQPNASSLQTVSSSTLQMEDLSGGKPFYSHTFTAGNLNRLSDSDDVEFYIEFSRGDGPALVTLSYVQTASDDSDQECVDQLTRVVRPGPAISPQVSIDSGAATRQALRRKPVRILYSGDGGALLAGSGSTWGRLRWSAWNTEQARARGEDWHNNCVPDCADGSYSGYPVTVRLWRPGLVDGFLVFTRMTVTYTGARPPYPAYQHRTLTYELHYDSQHDMIFWE